MKTKISLIAVFMLGLSGCVHQQNTAQNSDEITPMPDSLLKPQMQPLPPQDRIVSKDIYHEQTTSNIRKIVFRNQCFVTLVVCRRTRLYPTQVDHCKSSY